MAALFPGALPAAGSASPSATLVSAGHTSLHNTGADESRAIATKVGIGASTPSSGTVLRGNGAGTSAWMQVALTTDVTGVLPQANGGTGTTLATGTGKAVYDTSPTISGAILTGSPTLTTPTVADFTNANHTHANAAGGGLLNGANAITDGTLTPAELTSGTGSSWAWDDWTPTWTNLTVGNGVVVAKYKQIGKTVTGYIGITFGTTTSITTSDPRCSSPVPYSANTPPKPLVGNLYLEDAGVTGYSGTIRRLDTDNTLYFGVGGAGSTYVLFQGLSATIPFSWGTGDFFHGVFSYEAA